MPDQTDHPSLSTLTGPALSPDALGGTRVSHGRYLLGEVIGSGGFGQVHRALDGLTHETVAIKFVPALSPTELARARRELAALRWLRLPGVVRLRDDGLEGSSWFMVMDLVDGCPFDEIAVEGDWEAWSPCVLALLEVLARVHLAGVLHLDLKPSNVLVTPEGQVVLLDLGIARGRAVPEGGLRPIEGTPRFMAPEQRRGESCDARTDLYAVGVMLARMALPLPPQAQALVSALCAADPRDRPGSALEAYAALAGRSPFPEIPQREHTWSHEDLRALFADSGRFTHIPEDAAQLLWERTAGQPDQVQSTLQSWLLTGHVGWREGSLVLDRLALERLSRTLSQDLLRADVHELLASACAGARSLRRQGRLDSAVALLEAVFPLAQDLPLQERIPAEEELLAERVLAALATERADAADLALYALERAYPTHLVEALSGLVRVVRAVLRGEGASARAHTDTLQVFTHPELEIRRAAYRTRAAGLLGIEAEGELLASLVDWAEGDALREAKRSGWLGYHLYNRGLYREAALAHERAVMGKAAPIEQLSSTIGAASAWLEAPDLVQASARAHQAAQLACEIRHPRFEAMAVWMIRTAAYRACRPEPPDLALIESAAVVGPDLEGMFATTDAATAFREASRALCQTLAERAAHKFASVAMTPGAQLTRALAAYAARDTQALALLAEDVRNCPIPDMELQVLAFARWRTPSPPPEWAERALRCAQARGVEQWTTRLDILSVEEALAPSPPEGSLG